MVDYIVTGQGIITIIDEVDSDLKELSWSFHQGYVMRREGSGERKKIVYLHRIILERVLGKPIKDSYKADHKNRVRLDNRRSNLREATNSENIANGPATGKLSRYRGVTVVGGSKKRKKNWVATVWKDNKRVFSKLCTTEEEAARAYDEQAQEIHGEFARLNFPKAQSPTLP